MDKDLISFLLSVVLSIGFFYLARYVAATKLVRSKDKLPIFQIMVFVVLVMAMVSIIITLPLDLVLDVGENEGNQIWEVRRALLAFLGVILSAAIALSSTSFLGNAFAGIMLRTIGDFKPGDFIRVNENFGSVITRGLFHVQMQTENRGLITLPNLLVASNPIEVIPSKNRIISSEVSLGYDVPHTKVIVSLRSAAQKAGLEKPFVYITSLGDFSVVYRIHGFLKDADELLLFTARSKLNEEILNALHIAEIEITSPTFMNQRQIDLTPGIPDPEEVKKWKRKAQEDVVPEQLIFDMAQAAKTIDETHEQMEKIDELIKNVKSELDAGVEHPTRKVLLKRRLKRMEKKRDEFLDTIEKKKKEMES